VVPGSTQPLTETSTRKISWGLMWLVRRADNHTTFMCRLSWNLGASTAWNPQGLSRPLMRFLYLYLYNPYHAMSPIITLSKATADPNVLWQLLLNVGQSLLKNFFVLQYSKFSQILGNSKFRYNFIYAQIKIWPYVCRFSLNSRTVRGITWRSLVQNFTQMGQGMWKLRTEISLNSSVNHGFHCPEFYGTQDLI
jgi:hypothetical protein